MVVSDDREGGFEVQHYQGLVPSNGESKANALGCGRGLLKEKRGQIFLEAKKVDRKIVRMMRVNGEEEMLEDC